MDDDVRELRQGMVKIFDKLESITATIVDNRDQAKEQLHEISLMNMKQCQDIKHIQSAIARLEKQEQMLEEGFSGCQQKRDDLVSAANKERIVLEKRLGELENQKKYTAKLFGWGVFLLGTLSFVLHFLWDMWRIK